MPFLTICAYIALAICLAGMLYRLRCWCALPVGPESGDAGTGHRLLALIKAVAMTFVSPRRLLTMLRAVVVDVLLQRPLLRESRGRWMVHMVIFYGTALLILMHVFDERITARLFSEYASTRNPFMFLRNLLGVLVLAGAVVVWRRRTADRGLRRTTTFADRFMLALLAGIVLSGASLEAVQIISPTLFDQMVADYMRSDDPEEIAPLKAYWADHFAVAVTPPPDVPELMEQGRRLHVDYCAGCHSRPGSAVMAYPLALAIKPLSAAITRLDLETWLWYLHFLVSCLALALLPFSKLMHLLTTPVSLVVRRLGSAETNRAINRATRRAMGLDACTHCGVCSRHCAVAPVFEVISNPRILPSEKLGGVGDMAAGRSHAGAQAELAEGSAICTACGRCTHRCPAGIDLSDIWQASISDLDRMGYPAPHVWIKNHPAHRWARILKKRPETADSLRQPIVRLAGNPETFKACIQCATCTNVCPVVSAGEDLQRDPELTPQQVMNLMRLQLREAAVCSRMVWDCVTCYKCQEYCPQGVRVADVLYELRNEACRRLSPVDDPDGEEEKGAAIHPHAGA